MSTASGWKPTITSTTDYNKKSGVKLAVYGKPAVGKTPLALTASRPLILAAEDGLGTIERAGLPFIRVRTAADLKNMTTWLSVPANIKDFDWIILDSLTNLSHLIYSESVKLHPTWSDPRKYYGEMTDAIIPFLQALFALDKNVCVIMWQGDETSPTGMFLRNVPITKGQAIATHCMHFFDVTLHMALHQVTQQNADGTTQQVTIPYLQAREFNAIFARDRHMKLDNYEPADLTHIYNKLTTH